jgi:NADH-quinone oxidoreductase subunit C
VTGQPEASAPLAARLAEALAPLGPAVLASGTVPGVPADTPSVEVVPAAWVEALRAARDRAGAAWLDWLGVVDEEDRLRVVCCVRLPDGPDAGATVLLETALPAQEPRVSSAVPLFAGAAWHEREAHEMYGVVFDGHPDLRPLLLPPGFVGHPLRKSFVLASRVARPWPGEHEPSGRTRRRLLPPGVPEPGTWGDS